MSARGRHRLGSLSAKLKMGHTAGSSFRRSEISSPCRCALLLDTTSWLGDDERGFFDPRVPDAVDEIEDAMEDSIDIDWR